MYKKLNTHLYAFNVFPERNVPKYCIFTSCLHVRKKVEEIQIGFFVCVCFISDCHTEGMANLRICILNIDHLEMKQA